MKHAALAGASLLAALGVLLFLQAREPSSSPGVPAAPPRASDSADLAALGRWRALATEHGISVGRDTGRGPLDGWRVRHQLSADHVLIVRVETERLEESRVIAQVLVEPVKSRYAEALVYFYRPGDGELAKRVQWTPRSGYVETVY